MCESALELPMERTVVTSDMDGVPSGYVSPVFVKDSDGLAK